MKWVWVESDEQLTAVLAEHAACSDVAVDTEFRRRDTYFPQVALLQLCWRDQAYLIDPTRISDLSGLRDLLTNAAVMKYLHSASEDLEVFEHWLGVLPQPLFDTQRAAGILGREAGLSYRALVLALMGIEVPKDETQSDWLKRPLTEAQLRYAALDVVYLLTVARQLREEAAAAEREDWILEDGARMAPGGRGPLAKFKSAWKLSSVQQSVLASLVDWRERRARERDKPRSWIADDKTLAAIAQRKPLSSGELAAIDGLPQTLVQRQGKALVSAVSAAVKGDFETDWEPMRPLSRSEKDRARSLAALRDEIAEEYRIAPELLAGNRDLEVLVRRSMGVGAHEPAHWQGWRQGVAIAKLVSAANGSGVEEGVGDGAG